MVEFAIVIEDSNVEAFEKELVDTINKYESYGYKVEIHYNATNYQHALLIVRKGARQVTNE